MTACTGPYCCYSFAFYKLLITWLLFQALARMEVEPFWFLILPFSQTHAVMPGLEED